MANGKREFKKLIAGRRERIRTSRAAAKKWLADLDEAEQRLERWALDVEALPAEGVTP